MKNSKNTRFFLALVIFSLIGQIAWVVENMYLNVFIYEMFGARPEDISLMVSASAVAATVTTLLVGALSDRLRKRKLFMCGGYILWGLSILGFALVRTEIIGSLFPTVTSVSALCITLVIALDCLMTFFGSSANDAAFNAWLTDSTDSTNRGAAEGINAMMPLVSILVVFGGFMFFDLEKASSWSVIFAVIGGLVTVIGILGFFIIKDNAVELHAQEAGAVIVRWGAEEGGASLWRFDEVDTSNALAELATTKVMQGKVSTGIGNTNQPIVRSTIRISGLEGAVEFQGVKGAFAGSDKNDITNVKAYFATNQRELFIDEEKKMTWREENGEQFGQAAEISSDGTFEITGTKILEPGDHYLWITYDIAENAKEGNTVDANITAYTVDGKDVAESMGNPEHSVTIFLSEGAVLMPMDKGSLYYRIPAITVTRDGKRLVTLTDDRKGHNSDLPSHCYLVAQYSEDFGRTWSDPVTVAGTSTTGGNYGHGDASIVTNRDNGEIVGIMTSAGTYGHGFFAGTAT